MQLFNISKHGIQAYFDLSLQARDQTRLKLQFVVPGKPQ